jgi:hypothetical protein
MKWGKELLFLLPNVGYVLIKVALDNILQRTFVKIKRNCRHKHTHTFKFIAVKYVMVTECKEIVKLNFSYLYSENIKM